MKKAKATLQTLSNDVNSLKQDMNSVKTDIGSLKKEQKSWTKILHEALFAINQKFDEQTMEFNKKLDQKFEGHTRIILDSNLRIIEELEKSREDRTILGFRQREHSDQLEKHESEISDLKKAVFLGS